MSQVPSMRMQTKSGVLATSDHVVSQSCCSQQKLVIFESGQQQCFHVLSREGTKREVSNFPKPSKERSIREDDLRMFAKRVSLQFTTMKPVCCRKNTFCKAPVFIPEVFVDIEERAVELDVQKLQSAAQSSPVPFQARKRMIRGRMYSGMDTCATVCPARDHNVHVIGNAFFAPLVESPLHAVVEGVVLTPPANAEISKAIHYPVFRVARGRAAPSPNTACRPSRRRSRSSHGPLLGRTTKSHIAMTMYGPSITHRCDTCLAEDNERATAKSRVQSVFRLQWVPKVLSP